jgi:hypothetical protein
MSWFGSAPAQTEEYRLDGIATIESAAQAHQAAQEALASLLALDKAGSNFS